MNERQKHGFVFEEKYIIENELIKEDNYTSPIDARDSRNIPYQIKTCKYKSSIDLGDYFRNSEKDEDFYFVVGFWKGSKNNIIDISKIFADKEYWNGLLCFDKKIGLKAWIKGVSNE